MPFVNPAQRAACYAQQRRDLKAGRVPKWKCHEYAHGEKKVKRLRGGGKRKTTRGAKAKKRNVPLSEIKRKLKNRQHGAGKVQTGPRGGKYVVFGKHKVYI